MDLIRPDITTSEYVSYLGALYGYYHALEPRLISADTEFCSGVLGLAARAKLAWIEQDLNQLSGYGTSTAIDVCQATPLIRNGPEAVGCAYVIEGSTLGGSVIFRHMQKHLGITPDAGARFLYGYGEATGEHWKSFIRAIEAMNFSVKQREASAISAIATFDTMREWLSLRNVSYHPTAITGITVQSVH